MKASKSRAKHTRAKVSVYPTTLHMLPLSKNKLSSRS